MKGVPVTANHIMTTYRRRFFTALILIMAIYAILPVTAKAATIDFLNPTYEDWDATMKNMGRTASIWLVRFRACLIPLLIVKFASNGFKLIGNTLLSKGEYRLDDIKREIFYTTVAAITIVIFPKIMDWAISLFERGQWVPPSRTIQ
jgi:hypothetical protein